MINPSWRDAITKDRIQALGLIRPTGQPDGQDYELVAVTPENIMQSHAELRFYPSDPDNLHLTFVGKPDWLRLPFTPTADTLQKVCDYYIHPGQDFERLAGQYSPVAHAASLQQGDGAIAPGEKDTVRRYFLGFYPDYDEPMVQFENAITMSGWASPAMIAQATADGDGGRFSQTFSTYSHSLITIERTQAYTSNGFVLELAYTPSFHAAFTRKLIDTHLKDTVYGSLPDDLPLDLIGFVYLMGFEEFSSPSALLKTAPTDVTAAAALSLTVHDGDFDEVFSALASRTIADQPIRDIVASNAITRGNRTVYDTIAAQGLSPHVKDAAHERNGWQA